ncbi:tol-pal system YbgF family protein [Candidatus Hydrogenedentota bacterium]
MRKLRRMLLTSVLCCGIFLPMSGTVDAQARRTNQDRVKEDLATRHRAMIKEIADKNSREDAVKKLRLFMKENPASPEIPFALMTLAHRSSALDRLPTVQAYYEIVTKYPGSEHAEKAAFSGVGFAHEFKMWDISRQFLELVLKQDKDYAYEDRMVKQLAQLKEYIKKNGPGNPIDYKPTRYDRINHIANWLRGGGALAGAKSVYEGSGSYWAEKYIQDYPNDEYIPDVLFLAGVRDYIRFPNLAAHHFENIINKYPDHKRVKRSRLYLPTVYEMMGEWAKAAHAWQKVLTLYPDSTDIDEFQDRYEIAKRRAELEKGVKTPLAELLK